MTNNYKTKLCLLTLLLITTISGFSQLDTIPNHGFETWTGSGSDYDATYWGDLNASTGIIGVYTVQRATGANVHSGNYAMELYTQYISFVSETAPGIAATTSINTNTDQIQGGFPMNFRPYKLKGWFKYAPASPDTFSAQITLFSGLTTGPVIGSGTFTCSTTTSSYTQFSAIINYTGSGTPDSAQILLLSSSSSSPQSGSKAYVDDLYFINCSTLSVSATPTAATCTESNGSAVATATGGNGPSTFLWSTNATTAILHNVAAATYTVVATDTEGCTASASVVVNSNNTTFSPGLTTTNSSCVNATGTATIAPSGGTSPYHYVWSNTDTSATISNLSPGSYDVTITDANGCSTSAAAAVGTATGPTATDSVANVLCFGGSTGSVTVTVSGGTGNLTYAWNNSDENASISGLEAGNYTLTITDANNCSFTLSATVSQPSAALTLADSTISVPCYGDTSGAVYLQVSGGTPGYSFSWNNSATTQNLTGLGAGSYSVTVTDANNCTTSAPAVISQPTALVVTPGVVNTTSQNPNGGSAWVTISGGTPPYSILWGNSDTYDTLTHLSADTYAVTVSDSLGCSVATQAIVSLVSGITDLGAVQVKIYPNPAQNQVIIQLEPNNSRYVFELYSPDGKLVAEENMVAGKNFLNVEQLSTGLYTYRLNNVDAGLTQYGKIDVIR